MTTKEFLLEFGLDTLRDLPDFEALEDAGLLRRRSCWQGIPVGFASEEPDEYEEPVADIVEDQLS